MMTFKLALGMPLKSRETEDKNVYKRLRKLLEENKDVPTAHIEDWDELAILREKNATLFL